MRKASLLTCCILIAVALGFIFLYDQWQSHDTKALSREEYEDFLNSHPFSKILNSQSKEKRGEKAEGDNPDLAMMQNYLLTMDPGMKRPTPEVLYNLNNYSAAVRDRKIIRPATSISIATQWAERGPQQVGGRTRALMFDPNDISKKKVWAGGVSGGLWYNMDITNSSSNWQKVDDFWDNLSISAIATDPTNPQVWYVGTGEFGYDLRGAGVWKTIDGGNIWTQLPGSADFKVVKDIAVRNESGVGIVYLAVQPTFEQSYNAGLYRSADGGTSWQQVLPGATNNTSQANLPTDIAIGADNTLYVGTAKHWFEDDAVSTIYKSATGLLSSWQSVDMFDQEQTTGRLVLACAPSDANVLYLLTEVSGTVGGVYKSGDAGVSWNSVNEPADADLGIPADDFSRGQAWYDLILAVDPLNEDIVYAGAVDWFRTTNGGNSWSQISKWWSGISITGPVVHADQHSFAFRPGMVNEAIIGNDGGVYYASSLSGAVSSPTAINVRNKNYNVTQFYTAAIHPVNADYMLGGTQDNGTQKFTQAGLGLTNEAFGGDGAMCFIDQQNPNLQIVSYVYNNVYLSTNGGASVNVTLLDDGSSGNFINNGAYDSNQKTLFTAKSENDIYRVRNVGSGNAVDQVSISLGTIATTMSISPYTTDNSVLFIGTSGGRLFRIDKANESTRVINEIGSGSFPLGSISCVAIGATEDQLLVTFSNFGVTSIWETRNGGTTWTNREGNLPNMPVRWAEYHPQNFNQVYLATELGVWTTDNIAIASPVWNSTNGGLANVRTDMLKIRKSDGVIMAATHGRGVFTAIIPSTLAQIITFNAIQGTRTFGDGTFNLTAESTSGQPVTFESSNTSVVTIAGNTATIVGAGTVDISAIQNGNAYYAPAVSKIQSLVVNKATQTITFSTLPEKDIDDPDFTLSASATSGLPVFFNSSNSSVAAVAGNLVAINGEGTATITASQAGNNNFLAAADVVRNFTVVTRILDIPASLDFGEVFVGESPSKIFTIGNAGTGSIQITNIIYPEAFEGVTRTVSGGIEVTVTFIPDDVINFSGDIVIESNATSGSNTVPVNGTGILITSSAQDPEGGIQVYPNPVKDLLKIKADKQTPETIVMVDMTGREMKFNRTNLREYTAEFDVSRLTKGTYILKVPREGGYFTKQINKQ